VQNVLAVTIPLPRTELVTTVYVSLLECDNLTTARSRLKKHITTKGDNWPVSNDKLTNIYLKQSLQFVKSINVDLLQNYVRTLQNM
jgi:hypothetical protein